MYVRGERIVGVPQPREYTVFGSGDADLVDEIDPPAGVMNPSRGSQNPSQNASQLNV